MEKSKFDELAESFGVIKQTKKMLYPRQIKLSEEFLQALKNEYYRLTIEEDVENPVRNRPQKFLKALQFHVTDLEKNKAAELEALKNMMDENTEPYEVTVKGEKEEGNKKVDLKKEEERRKEVEKENMEPLDESVYNKGDDFYNKYPKRFYWADERGWIDRQTGEIVQKADSGYGGGYDRHDYEWRRRRNRW